MVLDREFPPDIRVENEIEALQEAGHEIYLACYTRKNRKRYEPNKNYHIYRKPINAFHYKSSVAVLRLPFYFHFWRKFIRLLQKKNNFDAIHIHDLPLARIGYEISQEFQIPFILDLHENWPAYLRVSKHTNTTLGKLLSNNSQWEKYEQTYCHHANKIIVVVDEAKTRLKEIGIDEAKIHIVSNTINYSKLATMDLLPEKEFFTLIYAGAINEHRGLQVVLDALKLLNTKNTNIRFQIIGDGSYLAELKKIASKLGLEEKVDIIGWKPFEEMLAFIMRSDACIIPHRKSAHTDSTIPHKLFQYMYFGKPVISSNCTPIQRILEDTNSGLIYVHDKAADLARVIDKLASDSNLYRDLSLNGKPAVKAKYNWNVDAAELNGTYNSLI